MNALIDSMSQRLVEEQAAKQFFPLASQRRAVHHLSSFLEYYCEAYLGSQRESFRKSASFLTMKKWSDFGKLTSSIHADLSSSSAFDVDGIFLKDGLCTAANVQYFSGWFQKRSPLDAIPFPVLSDPLNFSKVKFYPLNPADPSLVEKTRHTRFLQAAYKIASKVKPVHSFEYVPEKLLKQHQLEVTSRLPSTQASPHVLPIEELLKTLKGLEGKGDKERGIMLGLAGPQNHSIALYFDGPTYHFLDPRYGVAIAETKEEFMLFLAHYLTVKYPDHAHFALLEFSSTAKKEGSKSLSSSS